MKRARVIFVVIILVAVSIVGAGLVMQAINRAGDGRGLVRLRAHTVAQGTGKETVEIRVVGNPLAGL